MQTLCSLVQVCEEYCLVYVVTSLGLLRIYDLITATGLYCGNISRGPVMCASGDGTGGIRAINR